jgi:predicted N-acetyltransferase YhbS
MFHIRPAVPADVASIDEVFRAVHPPAFSAWSHYEREVVRDLIESDRAVIVVAEDSNTGRVVGVASVDLEVGGESDQLGEFGRLAVHPAFRHCGIGKALMAERLRRVEDRLEVALVTVFDGSPSLNIAEASGFAAVGFVPLLLDDRTSLVVLTKYFAGALSRRAQPSLITPQILPLAMLALANCSLEPDVIVERRARTYPVLRTFALREVGGDETCLALSQQYPVYSDEILSTARMYRGPSTVGASRVRTLIARENGAVVGAVAFTIDDATRTVRILNLAAKDERPITCLLEACCERAGSSHVRADVSAYAPRMQLTLTALGLLPIAYVPALTRSGGTRCDVVKMARVPVSGNRPLGPLTPRSRAVAEAVLSQFRSVMAAEPV